MQNIANSDRLADLDEVKNKFVKFNKPGDFIRGTLTKIFEVPNRFSDGQSRQAIYEINATEGEYHEIGQDGQPADPPVRIVANELYNVGGGKAAIDTAMRKIKIGQVIGIIFTGTKPSKTKGHNAYKTFIIKAGGMDPRFEETIGI